MLDNLRNTYSSDSITLLLSFPRIFDLFNSEQHAERFITSEGPDFSPLEDLTLRSGRMIQGYALKFYSARLGNRAAIDRANQKFSIQFSGQSAKNSERMPIKATISPIPSSGEDGKLKSSSFLRDS